MEYFLLLHSNNGYANALQCYAIRTLSVLFYSCIATHTPTGHIRVALS